MFGRASLRYGICMRWPVSSCCKLSTPPSIFPFTGLWETSEKPSWRYSAPGARKSSAIEEIKVKSYSCIRLKYIMFGYFSVLSQWDTRQSILSISNENTKLSFISNDQRRKISADLTRDSKFDLSHLQNKVQTPYRNMQM